MCNLLKCCIPLTETLLMKKINLSIPRPCHQSWDRMTEVEKGKFCTSCQKTVIDFTSMSDRQLAEFFKKPEAATCGRFHSDQLNRDIEIPRKGIPWIKYIFQITWPAFVFFLKSCGVKTDMRGKIKIESIRKGEESTFSAMKVGEFMPKIIAVEPTKPKDLRGAFEINRKLVIGDTTYRKESTSTGEMPEVKPLVGISKSLSNDSIAIKVLPKPTPVLPACRSFEGNLGGVIVVGYSMKQKRQKPFPSIKKIIDTAFKKFSVYPNPVQRNSNMRIDLKKLEAGQYKISIISMSGEVVQTEEIIIENKNQAVDFHVSETTAGTYLVHVFNKKTAASYSEKIIVQ